MGHVYSVGETPQKAWQRVPYRGLWFIAALGSAVVVAWALRSGAPALPSDSDSPLALLPLAVATVFALLAACAAYRARMMGHFADEHPEVFAAHPRRSRPGVCSPIRSRRRPPRPPCRLHRYASSVPTAAAGSGSTTPSACSAAQGSPTTRLTSARPARPQNPKNGPLLGAVLRVLRPSLRALCVRSPSRPSAHELTSNL